MTIKQINQCQDDMIKLRREHLDNEIYRHRYLTRIDQLEEEGLTTSDAQAVIDAENLSKIEDRLETGAGNRPDLTENEQLQKTN